MKDSLRKSGTKSRAEKIVSGQPNGLESKALYILPKYKDNRILNKEIIQFFSYSSESSKEELEATPFEEFLIGLKVGSRGRGNSVLELRRSS